jgi:O-6-methylguanine DNA methyltransferase
MSANSFNQCVYRFIAKVPAGKVTTYKQIAVNCGKPLASRRVGQIAHFVPVELPWHRLIKTSGNLASGFVPGGTVKQKQLLESEGITFINDKINLKDYLY